MSALVHHNADRLRVAGALRLCRARHVRRHVDVAADRRRSRGACGPDGIVAGPPGRAAEAIPAGLLALDRAADRRYRVPWNVLAAVNKVDTDLGRNLGVSRAGAIGRMQLLPATMERCWAGRCQAVAAITALLRSPSCECRARRPKTPALDDHRAPGTGLL